jgi:hypothetical protein
MSCNKEPHDTNIGNLLEMLIRLVLDIFAPHRSCAIKAAAKTAKLRSSQDWIIVIRRMMD